MASTQQETSFLQRMNHLIQKIESSTDITINDFDDVVKRIDSTTTLDKFMERVPVKNKNEPAQIGLLLPDINHHKLNYGDQKYEEMKTDIKHKMITKAFDRCFHVIPIEISNSLEVNDAYPTPLYEQGRVQKNDVFEVDGYAKLLNDVDNGSIALLDGLHRTFAMAEVLADESSNWEEEINWTKDIDVAIVNYIPVEEIKTVDENEKYLSILPHLSRKIADEAQRSLNTTLIDAMETVANIDPNRIHFLSDLLAKKDNNDVQFAFARQMDYQKEEANDKVILSNVVDMYKILTRSSDFLVSFKTRYSNFTQDISYQHDFWTEDAEFVKNKHLGKYFTTDKKLCSAHFFKKVHTRSLFQHNIENSQNSVRIDYRAYCIAATLEPVFFHKQYKSDMTTYLNVLRGTKLISTHRLMYIATLAYVTAGRIVEGWLIYDPFLEGTLVIDQRDESLKKKENGGTPVMRTRRAIIKKIFFNFVVTSLFQMYSNFESIEALNDDDLNFLNSELRNVSGVPITTKRVDQDELNLSIEFAEIITKYEENTTQTRKEIDIKHQTLDLLALRYVDYLRTLLMRNGPRKPHTLQYQLALLRKNSISDFYIKPEMHIFDFEGQSQHLTKIYNIFRNGKLEMFQDREQTQILPKHAYMCRRKKMYLSFMHERFGNLITEESMSSLERINDTANVQFGENAKFTTLKYDGTTFIKTVLTHMRDTEKQECWYNPLNISKFLNKKLDFSSPDYKNLRFFGHIAEQYESLSQEAEKYFKRELGVDKAVNDDFAKYLRNYCVKIASLKGKPDASTEKAKKTKDKKGPKATENDEDDQEEEQEHGHEIDISSNEQPQEIQPIISWNTLHKEMFQNYKKYNKAEQDRWVSNCINVAISAFVKGGKKPKLKTKRKSKTWITNETVKKSDHCDFTEKKVEELKFYFEDYSNQNFFKEQDTLDTFTKEDTKETETQDETKEHFSPETFKTFFKMMTSSMKQSPELDHPVLMNKRQASTKKRSRSKTPPTSTQQTRRESYRALLSTKKRIAKEQKANARKRKKLQQDFEKLQAIEKKVTEASIENSDEENQSESSDESVHSSSSSESSQEAEWKEDN